jgi:mono/diheme cytochrome c family protein
MKSTHRIGLTLAIASALLLPALSRANEDVGAEYRRNCAGCHGTQGEGKPTMKSPALKGTSLTAAQLATFITSANKGSQPPHQKAIFHVNSTQAKAIANYIKYLGSSSAK